MDPVQPALNAFSLLPVMAYEVNAMMCELGTSYIPPVKKTPADRVKTLLGKLDSA